MKLHWLLISLCLAINSVPLATQAYTLDKLGDTNFGNLLNSASSQWLCSVTDNTTSAIELCNADTDYTAANPGGVTIGTTGQKTVLSQVTASLDNTNNLPIVRLVFDYRVTEQTSASAANFIANLVGADYVTHTLFSSSVNQTGDWTHVVVDLSPYAAGNPSIEFVLDNGTDGNALVSIRHAHLYVRSYVTLQASFQDRTGNPVTTGRLMVLSHSGDVIRSQQVSDGGRIALLQIPGSRSSYRIRFSYHGRHYYTTQRFRYGDDFVYTWKLKPHSHSLQAIE